MAAAQSVPELGFGIEIEAVCQPWKVRREWDAKPQEYYQRLAQALKNRGLEAVADKLDGPHRNQHPEHYTKWFITRDGSLRGSGTQVCLEAVSPILYTTKEWEEELIKFWDAIRKVFKVMEEDCCGSHVHVAPDHQRYTLGQLKIIAFAVVTQEHLVKKLLPKPREDNQYCKLNSEISPTLSATFSRAGKNETSFRAITELIRGIQNASQIEALMQGNRRYVIWNFENITKTSGTIEFRGGRHLRGPNRSFWWITFAVAFVSLSLRQNHLGRMFIPVYNAPSNTRGGPFQVQMLEFWEEVKEEADELNMGGHLPGNWKRMMEKAGTH